MKTGRMLIWLIAAAAFAAGACDGGSPLGRSRQDLDSSRDHDEYEHWPSVTEDDVDDLPSCSEIDLPAGMQFVFVVQDGGGLLALSVDGTLICVDDGDGLVEAGVPEQIIPDETEAPDNPSLLPTDGTPLPAGPTNGVTDGTPLPA